MGRYSPVLLACFLVLFSFVLPGTCRADPPRVLLILFDSLQASDLTDPTLPHLRSFAESGQTALLNTSVAGPKNDLSAVLTLALGALSPSEPTDGEIYEDNETVERTSAANVYRRRVGSVGQRELNSPVHGTRSLVHTGWASFIRRSLDDRLIGSVLMRAGRRPFLPIRLRGSPNGEGRAIGLFGVDGSGIGSSGRLVSERKAEEVLRSLASTNENIAVSLAPGSNESRQAALARLDHLLASLIETGAQRACSIMLVSPHPPLAPDGSWDRLSLLIMSGPGIPSGLATSATTRTAGLVANIDVAPTLLSWMGVGVPATMTGHIIPDRSPYPSDLNALLRMDRKVFVSGHALDPVFIVLGVIAAIVVTVGLCLRLFGQTARPAALGVLILLTMPLAMLMASLVEAPSVGALALLVLVFMIAVGSAVWMSHTRGARLTLDRTPLVIAILTVALVIADTLFNGRLVKFSLFSSYQLQGIRFYGIGNEYMSVLIGFTLMVAFMERLSVFRSALLFTFVAFVIGWPALGANAGGLIAATAGFIAAWQRIRGKKIGVAVLIASSIAGLGLALVFALLDRQLTGGSASHLGGAVSAASERGWSYLAEIALRKSAMNLRILVHPAVICALIGVFVIVCVGNRGETGAWRRLAEKHPSWSAGLLPAAHGAAAGFIFNDSGIVVALFLMGTFLATGVYLLFLDDTSVDLPANESGTLKTSSVEC